MVTPSAQVKLGAPGAGDGHLSRGQGLGGAGAGLQAQVGHPLASSTLPYWQKMSHTGPHIGWATQAQTLGEWSKTEPRTQATF